MFLETSYMYPPSSVVFIQLHNTDNRMPLDEENLSTVTAMTI